MNPYQRDFQITIPSSDLVRKMGVEMIDATRRRRSFQGRSFNKQSFYNCAIMGLYQLESNRDLDLAEVESKGLLAVVIDRGAAELSKLIASADSPVLSRGVRAAVDEWDEEEDGGIEEPETAPPPKTPHRKPPGLIIPNDWVLPSRAGRDSRAEQEANTSRFNPVP